MAEQCLLNNIDETKSTHISDNGNLEHSEPSSATLLNESVTPTHECSPAEVDDDPPESVFEPIAGPSQTHYESYLVDQVVDVIDGIDALLDNTLNETQERILQDNRTPERLISRNAYDENMFNDLLTNKHKQIDEVESGASGSDQVYIKNKVFSDIDAKTSLIFNDEIDESVAHVDPWTENGDDIEEVGEFEEPTSHEDESIMEEEIGNEEVVAVDDEEEVEYAIDDIETMHVHSVVNERLWRKRKLETQNAFPSKKLFPESNKTALTTENIITSCTVNNPTKVEHCVPPPVVEKKPSRFVSIPTKDNPPPEMTGWLSQFSRWSNAERLLAIDELIERCEPTQVRHMMQVIEPQFQRDFISLLPKELALNVLSFLEPKDILRAAQTCRSWRFLADDNLLWREKCREAGIIEAIQSHSDEKNNVPKKVIAKGDKNVELSKKGILCGESTSAEEKLSIIAQAINWKAVFMRQHQIEMNWRVKPIRPPKVLKGHDDHVITCLQFHGNRIVSGSDDNTLKVWSADTGKCLKTLVGHTGGVWSSQMNGNLIISGSTDRTLKVWNAENGDCLHTLYGHTSTVRCMHLHGNRVVSGSRDATLRMWDVVSGECLHVLVGHLAAVRCVQYDGRLVVSGAYDYMVKVWNPEREECLHTLQGHTNRVYSLQFDGVHVVSGSLDTSIRVWEVETGACRHTLMGHQSLTSGMELRNNILVSGNADSTVKVWDIVTGQCLQTLSGANKHQSAVTCLQFNSRFVITSSDDGTVKLWDVRTGAFIRNLVALDSGGSGGVVWRIRANETKLVCAVGSRNGTEETKLLVLDFDVEETELQQQSPFLSSNSYATSCCSSSNCSSSSLCCNHQQEQHSSSPPLPIITSMMDR